MKWREKQENKLFRIMMAVTGGQIAAAAGAIRLAIVLVLL